MDRTWSAKSSVSREDEHASHPLSWHSKGTAARLLGQKDALVAEMRHHKYLDLAEVHGFEILAGKAWFKDSTTLIVDGQDSSAGAYLVASGSEPAIPPLPGLAEAGFLTSTTAVEQTSLAERLVTIGQRHHHKPDVAQSLVGPG